MWLEHGKCGLVMENVVGALEMCFEHGKCGLIMENAFC